MASIIEQTNAKLSSGEVTEEQHKAIIDDCTEYIKSAKEMCKRNPTWIGVYVSCYHVPILISMWSARMTKTIFLLLAGYLGLQCIRASLWIPLILCILLFTFIIQLKNKEL
jgi:hypothetical protein